VRLLLSLAAALFAATTSPATEPGTERTFDFGAGPVPPAVTRVSPGAAYTPERGYGFEPGAKVITGGGCCTSDAPFFFSVAVPEGNYAVTLTLGDAAGVSDTTVKAELRRLMVERVVTAKGATATRAFAVNVRTPRYAGGTVRLKDREKADEGRAWDGKLTLEFSGPRPCVRTITVAPADVPTVYLLGDSTVCDQPREPYASWGQMLPRFFGPGVAVSNQAESGESLRGSVSAGRVAKVLTSLRAGDFVLVQFGHNDMKSGTAEAYRADLSRLLGDVRKRGGTPVVVTPVNRRSFAGPVVTNSLKGFPDAARAAARDSSAALIDLHAMSKTLYEALGPQGSGTLFKSGDGTHHANYGAYELAKCVVEGVRVAELGLVKFLAADVTPFDPAKPDPVADFRVPPSPSAAGPPPDGK
jgi:lysophospholipase L1-like esterase